MSDKKQILLAFFIPLSLGIGLILIGYFFVGSECSDSAEYEGRRVCFEYRNASLIEQEYFLLVLGLFILSLVLPSFVTMRTYQGRRNKLESGSIIK